MATTKVTYSLDDEALAALEQTAARLRRPKSRVVREAILEYAARADTLSSDEREQLLQTLDRILPLIPERPVAAVEAELKDVRDARRAGGRPQGSAS